MKRLLFVLTFAVAVSASLIGLLILAGVPAAHPDLLFGLRDQPVFTSKLLPALILTALVGGSNLTAVYFFLQGDVNMFDWAIAGGTTLLICVITSLMFLHASHWLYYVYLFIGIIIVLIAWQLKGKWVV